MSSVYKEYPTKEIEYLKKYPGVQIVDKIWTGAFKSSIHVTLDPSELHQLSSDDRTWAEIQYTLTAASRLRMDNTFLKFLDKHGVPTGNFSVVDPLIYRGLGKGGRDVSNLTESVNHRVRNRPLSYNNVYVMATTTGVLFWIN